MAGDFTARPLLAFITPYSPGIHHDVDPVAQARPGSVRWKSRDRVPCYRKCTSAALFVRRAAIDVLRRVVAHRRRKRRSTSGASRADAGTASIDRPQAVLRADCVRGRQQLSRCHAPAVRGSQAWRTMKHGGARKPPGHDKPVVADQKTAARSPGHTSGLAATAARDSRVFCRVGQPRPGTSPTMAHTLSALPGG